MSDATREVFEVDIRGRIDDVWREITKTDEVQKVMFDMRLESDLRPGSKMRMKSANGKYTGAVGEVLEFDPPRRYAHTFRFTQYDDDPVTITYDLEETAEGVRFRMTLDGLKPDSKSGRQMKSGGTMILRNLKSIVEKGKVPLGTRVLYGMFRVMAPLTPKRCRSENWE